MGKFKVPCPQTPFTWYTEMPTCLCLLPSVFTPRLLVTSVTETEWLSKADHLCLLLAEGDRGRQDCPARKPGQPEGQQGCGHPLCLFHQQGPPDVTWPFLSSAVIAGLEAKGGRHSREAWGCGEQGAWSDVGSSWSEIPGLVAQQQWQCLPAVPASGNVHPQLPGPFGKILTQGGLSNKRVGHVHLEFITGPILGIFLITFTQTSESRKIMRSYGGQWAEWVTEWP